MKRAIRTALAGALAVGAVLTAPATALAEGRSTVTRERGHAAFCTGSAEGVSVSVELYENSAYGAFPSVRVERGDEEFGGGGGPLPTGLFTDGRVAVELPIRNLATREPAGVAAVNGSHAAAGPAERVHEVRRDAGEVVVVQGTNTPLTVAGTVEVLDTVVPLSCAEAFAFDLEVRRTRVFHQD